MKFPTFEEMAKEVAEKALDEFEYKGKTLRQWIDAIYAASESFEWCDGCKEYDQEQHCCHRFTKVIRNAVEDMQIVRCKDCIYADYMDDVKALWCSEGGRGKTVAPDDYCSYAERRWVTT